MIVPIQKIRKIAEDVVGLARLLVENRSLQVAKISTYARTALRASLMVEAMRERYPDKKFCWSFSTNHVLDSEGEYVCLWEVAPGPRASFLFHGPVGVLTRMVGEGRFDGELEGDGVREDLASEEDEEGEGKEIGDDLVCDDLDEYVVERKYKLVDVVKRSAAYPDTFVIPGEQERNSLRLGDVAKLFFGGRERMWVEVSEITRSEVGEVVYRGSLLNEPVDVPLALGDLVVFCPRHVAEIDRPMT